MGEAGRGYWDEEELGHGIIDRIKCETTPLGKKSTIGCRGVGGASE
jgi:hypothetical protein